VKEKVDGSHGIRIASSLTYGAMAAINPQVDNKRSQFSGSLEVGNSAAVSWLNQCRESRALKSCKLIGRLQLAFPLSLLNHPPSFQ